MPDEPDELTEYLQGASALSRQYQREAAPLPPQPLDRLVLDAAGSKEGALSTGGVISKEGARSRELKPRPRLSQSLAPLAFAASVFLSVALVLAMVFNPQPAKKLDDRPQVLRVRAYETAPPRSALTSRERNPVVWLEDIAALRREGRNSEADIEMQRFRSAYPAYLIPVSE
jgi:hypothetical protein